MQVELSESFEQKFKIIVNHIAKDKIGASINFRKSILRLLKELATFPYKYRKSFYFDDNDIRDMTYKGYTIVYKIYVDKKHILVVDIFNQNKPAT